MMVSGDDNMQEILTIGKHDYKVKNQELLQANLKFYPENPRVYSVLDVSKSEPTQEEIEKVMCKMDHVKQLKESIKANGGLIDPLIVRDGDYIVLEGNSRLAAYRMLYREDPIKWAKVRCMLLPADISDAAIFTLIGQYHIVGRKDWDPYEQAGYLRRRIQASNQSIEGISKELGLSVGKAKEYVEVYQYMIDKKDNHPEKWSYYEELLKSRSIKKYIDTVDGLEDEIVRQIKSNEINRALDVREYLGGIAKIKSDKDVKKVMRDIAEEGLSIYEGYERLERGGKTSDVYNTLVKFRKRIAEDDFKERVAQEKKTGQIKMELSKIIKESERLIKMIDSKE